MSPTGFLKTAALFLVLIRVDCHRWGWRELEPLCVQEQERAQCSHVVFIMPGEEAGSRVTPCDVMHDLVCQYTPPLILRERREDEGRERREDRGKERGQREGEERGRE